MSSNDKKDYLSATTIAQCSFCETQLVLAKRYGKRESDLERIRKERGDEEHLRHHLEAIKHGKAQDSRCFIASEVYGVFSPESDLLRNFRDTVLDRNIFGRIVIAIYYDFSPLYVKIIRRSPLLKSFSKWVLDKLVVRMAK